MSSSCPENHLSRLFARKGTTQHPFVLAAVVLTMTSGLAAPDKAASEAPSAQEAWEVIHKNFKKRVNSEIPRTKVIQTTLQELESFARIYSGTEQAVFAWYNHGSLAMQIGDYTTAESSLKKARKLTEDPRFKMAINMSLAKLNVSPGKTPPDFQAMSLDGKALSPGSYKGKVLLIDFWATWCGPCRAELPNLKQIYKENHPKGFEIVSVSLDQDEDQLRSFVKDNEMVWTHVFNGSFTPGEDPATSYGAEAIPFMVLVGKDGKIAGAGLRGAQLGEAVEKALAAK